MNVVVITPPEGSPLLLPLAKAQCRVTTGDDDDFIQSLIDTATAWLDGPGGWLGRCLMPQTLELRLEGFEEQGRWRGGRIALPFPPFISVNSIVYKDVNGADQTLDPGTYIAGSCVEPVIGKTWPPVQPGPNAVCIQYNAGYSTGEGNPPASTVPTPIRHAMMLLVSHWYRNRDAVVGVDNRDSSTEMPMGVEALLTPYRIW